VRTSLNVVAMDGGSVAVIGPGLVPQLAPNMESRLRRSRLRAESEAAALEGRPTRWKAWLKCPRPKPHIVYKEAA
jgi:hypothetical protein